MKSGVHGVTTVALFAFLSMQAAQAKPFFRQDGCGPTLTIFHSLTMPTIDENRAPAEAPTFRTASPGVPSDVKAFIKSYQTESQLGALLTWDASGKYYRYRGTRVVGTKGMYAGDTLSAGFLAYFRDVNFVLEGPQGPWTNDLDSYVVAIADKRDEKTGKIEEAPVDRFEIAFRCDTRGKCASYPTQVLMLSNRYSNHFLPIKRYVLHVNGAETPINVSKLETYND